MKPKKIQIALGTPIEKWADENRGVIMDSIYYNLSEFIESQEDDRVILQVIPTMNQRNRVQNSIEPPMNVDFIISKDDIDLTIKKVLDYYIEIEEYEKCAEIVKMQNQKDNPKPKKNIRRKRKEV
jgi:hypothetical protein